MTTHAERYRAHWATLTGRNPSDVYTPEAIRDPAPDPAPDHRADPEWASLAKGATRHRVKGTAREGTAAVWTWCGMVLTEPVDGLGRRPCRACTHNHAANLERIASRRAYR